MLFIHVLFRLHEYVVLFFFVLFFACTRTHNSDHAYVRACVRACVRVCVCVCACGRAGKGWWGTTETRTTIKMIMRRVMVMTLQGSQSAVTDDLDQDRDGRIDADVTLSRFMTLSNTIDVLTPHDLALLVTGYSC